MLGAEFVRGRDVPESMAALSKSRLILYQKTRFLA